MKNESLKERSKRILEELYQQYPGTKAYDLNGRDEHFVCEVEPVNAHPEYDRAIEVIINSLPHKHLKMTQHYTIIKGNLELHIGKKIIKLNPGDKYTINPGNIHWAKSDNESWVEIYSEPGWTVEDHILVK